MNSDSYSSDITDLRRDGMGGGTGRIVLTVKGEERNYWCSVGDTAQAIKRIEQELRNPPEGWGDFRELYLAASASGALFIADDPVVAAETAKARMNGAQPWLVLSLNRIETRRMAGEWLGEDLGKLGTADLAA